MVGNSQVIIRQWHQDDAYMKGAFSLADQHWIGIRGIPLHLLYKISFDSICHPWGKVVEVHLSTTNTSKLNSYKVKVLCDLNKIHVVVDFKDIWLSIEWIQEESFVAQEHKQKLKSVVMVVDSTG